MNKEAEINKELIKVLKEKIQLLEEQKANSQEIINAQKEQLILSSVSQQRITSTNKQTMSKKLIQKLQQLLDKLPKGKERKAIRERLLKLKLNKNVE